ncbi:hotdog fold domain-containing protein [Phycicoccus sp.]|uniref:hotdog fold domain-containing protein n=1 Tax=Phycicoccus sp. TaxID=1902410 RepID=UPI002C82AF96|nr:hotdog fold domain-containing protein [Phycicoccus sp.]HMM96892.1 hotdog fold domain-containing protein [Phycicoccus sp.]
MPDTAALYRRLAARPLGKEAFSALFALRAPYFRTVRPRVREMGPHHAALTVAKRWGVQNHLGTVHAIAVCNGLEAAMGLLAEATTPPTHRWIPKGMEVRYLAKSTTDLLCTADTTSADWAVGAAGDVPVSVRAVRTDGTVVVEGTITIYVSERPSR